MENQNALNSVKFLFAKPYSEGHYLYSLDDLESLSIIDKDSLRELLIKLECRDFIKMNELLDRNFPLFFDAKQKKLMEFQSSNPITKKDISDNLMSQMKENYNSKTQSKYEMFFGKDSDFYKQNFNEDLFKKLNH